MDTLVYDQVVLDPYKMVVVSQVNTYITIFLNTLSGFIPLKIDRKIIFKQLKPPPPTPPLDM